MNTSYKLPIIPKQVKEKVKEGHLFVLFLSDSIFELSNGEKKGNGLWKLTLKQYEDTELILKQDVLTSQFLIVAISNNFEASSNVFFNDSKISSSPYLSVKHSSKDDEIKLLAKVYDDSKLKVNILIEGVPEFIKVKSDKKIENCIMCHNFNDQKEFVFQLPKNKKIEDFVLTVNAIFENKTSTSVPVKIYSSPKEKLEKVFSIIHDFQLKEDKDSFLHSIKIRNLPSSICLSKGIKDKQGNWLLKTADLKDLRISSTDSNLKSIILELEYSVVKNHKVQTQIKTHKINFQKDDGLFDDTNCLTCENREHCEIIKALKYEYPYSPYLKYIE